MTESTNKPSLKKKENENAQQYLYRVDGLIRSGEYTNWNEVTAIVNQELFGDDEDSYKGESAYRKETAAARKYYEAGVFSPTIDSNDIVVKMREERDKLYAAKRELADQRREYNKLVVQDGRANNLTDKMIECANKLNAEFPLGFKRLYTTESGEKEGLLIFSDWHYGMVTDNIWNKYNTEICKERVKHVVEETIKYIRLFGLSRLHVINLGDAFHGSIHISCRIASEEDTCDQIMHVSEILAEAISELAKYVPQLDFYSCYGNHCRSIQLKSDSIHSDNMEKIVPWWMKQRLKDYTNICFHDSEYKEFTTIKILGYNIVAVHGDLDNIKEIATTINTLFNRKFNLKVDYVISGDKHHLEEFERFDIESVIIRSLCGTDDYANQKRLYSCPGQTLMIFNPDEGRECTRNIKCV